MKSIVCLSMFALLSAVVSADTLKPFRSDGCSYFPDGNFAQGDLWLSCCLQHDFAYWKGGTAQQRLVSDQALKICVANVGEPTIGALMLGGVRVGGTPLLPTSFRWGYGWSYPRSYGQLTTEELQQVQQRIIELQQSDNRSLLLGPAKF